MPLYTVPITHRHDLLSDIKNGDATSVGRLYDFYAPLLYGAILREENDKAVANAILVATFLKIVEQQGKYDAGKSRIFTWMMQICRQQMKDTK